MDADIVGAALAFLVGVGIATANFALSRHILKTRPDMYAAAQTVKQLVQVAYLVALFLLGGYTPWDNIWLLVGGGLGITLPMILFTYLLVRINDSNRTRGKEEHTDG